MKMKGNIYLKKIFEEIKGHFCECLKKNVKVFSVFLNFDITIKNPFRIKLHHITKLKFNPLN